MRLNNVHFINVGGVSIHASVKDATVYFLASDGGLIVSIHASVKDATFPLLHYDIINLFQSTHL